MNSSAAVPAEFLRDHRVSYQRELECVNDLKNLVDMPVNLTVCVQRCDDPLSGLHQTELSRNSRHQSPVEPAASNRFQGKTIEIVLRLTLL